MAKVIKSFIDGSSLEYDQGSFDEWCVYLRKPDGSRRPPRDTEYFKELKLLGHKYGNQKVYNDYVYIYNSTGREVSREVLNLITDIATQYDEALQVDIMFTILYMAMIAEERKKFTRLGKRIKRLGVHKILIENNDIYHAANFMRGMGWQEIDRLCKERGF